MHQFTLVVLLTFCHGVFTANPARTGEQTDVEAIATEAASPNGALLLVGGGSLPREARKRFVELAGGKQAKIVVIPTASSTVEDRDESYWLAPWSDFELKSLELYHTRDRSKADSETFSQVLKQATGIWISGGAQSKLADAYLGTKSMTLIESLPHRGGIVGGTSAGAAIASRVMIAGGRTTPKMATGFNLLPNAIVDQHFSQRKRENRLKNAVSQFSECVGIGIDESTAVLFTPGKMEVIGAGKAHIHFAASEELEALHQAFDSTQTTAWESILKQNRERLGTSKVVNDSKSAVESKKD